MVSPTGEQYEIAANGYRAVVTESGATLRELDLDGRALIAGFAEDARPGGGAGQLLAPWPNRLRDGAYEFGGSRQQLPLSEPDRHNASHGLVRWVAWSVVEHTAASITQRYRLMAQSGYPWTLDLQVQHALGPDGLTVTVTAINRASAAAPYAVGSHPYLSVGGPIDDAVLTLPASIRLLTDDERLLPIGTEPVDGAYDFRLPKPIAGTVLNHAFTALQRDDDGLATVVLADPAAGRQVELWVDQTYRWLQLYSGEELPTDQRRGSLAVEPMTAPPDAFNSGTDLITLSPGEPHVATWGIRAR